MGTEDQDATGTITRLLRASREGDERAREELFTIMQADLRRYAQHLINGAGLPNGVLNGTELVNMACVRLLAQERLGGENRRHFFYLLGRAMRDELVEETRRRTAQKRGGGAAPELLVEFAVEDQTFTADKAKLMEALRAFEDEDPEAARIVRMLFFEGRSLRDAAADTGQTLAAVRGHWVYARAWLLRRING